jgi:hypothetical protein
MSPEMHYHVFMGAARSAPMQSTKIDDYDESIKKFLSLTKAVFGQWDIYELTFKNLLVASEFGKGFQMTLGNESLAVQWMRCRNPCMSPSWN